MVLKVPTKKQNGFKARYSDFGKFVINHYQLKTNILLVKYSKSHAPVPKIKGTIISNDFKNLITDLLKNESINEELQNKLKDHEIDLFDLLINISGLANQLNYKRIETSVHDIINKFEVLRGELVAGNNSDILKNDLANVITLLNVKYNKISDSDAIELLDILK